METNYFVYKDKEICISTIDSRLFPQVVGVILRLLGMPLLGDLTEPSWLLVLVHTALPLASKTSLSDISTSFKTHQVMKLKSK